MDENKGEIRLGLDLGLGLNDYNPNRRENRTPQNKKRTLFLDLSIPLYTGDQSASRESSSSLKITGKDTIRQGIVERINGFCGKEDDESKTPMDFEGRKKLRLTRDQTTLLEDSFKQQTTLNTAQKQALAEKLSLKPRQVEVWFQNRRARTKLKQIELDCDFLKRNCERLSEENWRLKKELFDLRLSLKIEKTPPPPPVLHHIPKAAREKNVKNRDGGEKKEPAIKVVQNNPKTN